MTLASPISAEREPASASPSKQGGRSALPRNRLHNRVLLTAFLALTVIAIASLAIGPSGVSFSSLPSAMNAAWNGATDDISRQNRLVLFDLRLPRTLIGAFVGAALAVSGAMMQGLFRNPLADPGIVGVSAGAAFAAVATIALGDSLASVWVNLLGIYALPVSAFIGGALTTMVLVAVAGRDGQLMVGTLLLAGIAFAALAGAGTGLIAQASNDQELRDLTLWQLGSLTGASWDKVYAVLPFALLLVVAIPRAVRTLNGLMLGEAEAFHLGINVNRAKFLIVTLTALAVGASVAVAGMIGFVGIVVPHFVRLITGPDNRVVLPASAIVGACILILADIIARVVVQPAELPIGIVMALIGAPVFLHLILRRRFAL